MPIQLIHLYIACWHWHTTIFSPFFIAICFQTSLTFMFQDSLLLLSFYFLCYTRLETDKYSLFLTDFTVTINQLTPNLESFFLFCCVLFSSFDFGIWEVVVWIKWKELIKCSIHWNQSFRYLHQSPDRKQLLLSRSLRIITRTIFKACKIAKKGCFINKISWGLIVNWWDLCRQCRLIGNIFLVMLISFTF